jgi:tetratricopeptide (TPR) repeat protein
MDSMEMANYWGTKKYSNFLNEFQRLMQHGICIWQKGIEQIKFAGDELVVFYCSKDIGEDIVNAIQLANTLKLMWYVSEPNRKRIKEGKKILDLGVGINTGDVTYEYRPVVNELKKFIPRGKTFEGLPISLAKRIESFSRQGRYSRIMVGHRTMAELNKLYHHYECESMGLQRPKGMSQEIPVFELKSCYSLEGEILGEDESFEWEIKQLERIRVFDPSNIWLLMTLIDIYRNKKNYKRVEKLCREAIAVDDSVSNIHHELGIALEEQGKYEEAVRCFDQAIRLRWNSWNSYVGKSACLVRLKSYDEAIRDSSYAVGEIPRWLRHHFCDALYYIMAAASARKGEKGRALANIRKAIKIDRMEVVNSLRMDEEEDFVSLYGDPEFERLKRGQAKGRRRRVQAK